MFEPVLFFAVLGMSYMVCDLMYSFYKCLKCKN